jgi:hypothetical protein
MRAYLPIQSSDLSMVTVVGNILTGRGRWRSWEEDLRSLSKREICIPHPSNGYLRVQVCYKVVSEMETRLGLLGLMNESHKNIIREILRGNPLSYPIHKKLI